MGFCASLACYCAAQRYSSRHREKVTRKSGVAVPQEPKPIDASLADVDLGTVQGDCKAARSDESRDDEHQAMDVEDADDVLELPSLSSQASLPPKSSKRRTLGKVMRKGKATKSEKQMLVVDEDDLL